MRRGKQAGSAHVAGEQQGSDRRLAQLFGAKKHREVGVSGRCVADLKLHGGSRLDGVGNRERAEVVVDAQHWTHEEIAASEPRLGGIGRNSNQQPLRQQRAFGFRKRLGNFAHDSERGAPADFKDLRSIGLGDHEARSDRLAALADDAVDLDVAEDRQPDDALMGRPPIAGENIEARVACAARKAAKDPRALGAGGVLNGGAGLPGVNRKRVGQHQDSAMGERTLVGWQRNAVANESVAPHRRRSVGEVEGEWAGNDAGKVQGQDGHSRGALDLEVVGDHAFGGAGQQMNGVQLAAEDVEGVREQRAMMKGPEHDQQVRSEVRRGPDFGRDVVGGRPSVGSRRECRVSGWGFQYRHGHQSMCDKPPRSGVSF